MTSPNQKAVFGVVGLAVMGENLALNLESKGFPVAVYNRTFSVTEAFANGRAAGKRVFAAKTLQDFVAALERPRRILIMVKAGPAVDAVMDQLTPLLDAGDILIDGGNSHFADTERRARTMEPTGLNFFGMGVSGGEEGALKGPSMMPGGNRAAYESLEHILTRVAAQSDTGPCVTYLGRGSAGHFVKMVHNGIEYGDMQLIAESYDLLRTLGGLDSKALADTFAQWNESELKSYLIEITADIVDRKDPDTGGLLVDVILDKAGQKGTGKWTTTAALDLGVSIPTITAAVDARLLSSLKGERTQAAKLIGSPIAAPTGIDRAALIQDVRHALYAAKVCSYAQGMAMLKAASAEHQYGLDLAEVARIWKAGCIIRAVFLDRIRGAFQRDNALSNLLIDGEFAAEMRTRLAAWRRVVALATNSGIAVPAMAASLAYFDGYRRERGPAYVIQAQRDYFGAHTFERTDKAGSFHFEWNPAE